MICTEYSNLTNKEQSEVIGKLIIAFQNDSVCFKYCKWVIDIAEQQGVYKTTNISDLQDPVAKEQLTDLSNPLENFLSNSKK